MAASKRPDAIALIKADHDKVQDLFEKFESAKGESRKETLAKQICMELIIHAMIEEEILYPACREAGVETDLLDEALVEHDAAKVLIAEIEAGADSKYFEAKVSVLSEEINHHIREEEKPKEGVLAQARKAKLDMAELGERLAARKQELMKQFKADGLPTPEPRTFASVELGGSGAAEDKSAGASSRGIGEEARPR